MQVCVPGSGNNMAVCLKCGHKWNPRLAHPARCPKCISKYWDNPTRGKGRARDEDTVLTTDTKIRIPTEYCKECKDPLQRMKWGPDTDRLFCINLACTRFYFGLVAPRGGGFSDNKERIQTRIRERLCGEDEESEENKGDTIESLQRMRDRILFQRRSPEVP